MYTKLKYSRCPQYDIISGGCGAFLAAFLAFLVTEKFGIELVDSGDFYIALMYGVFICLAIRPLLRSLSKDKSLYFILSPKYLIFFLKDLFIIFINFLKDALKNLYLHRFYKKNNLKLL